MRIQRLSDSSQLCRNQHDGVAQWIERQFAELNVAGSSPVTVAPDQGRKHRNKAPPALFYVTNRKAQRNKNQVRSCGYKTQQYALDAGWFNYTAQMLMYDEIFIPNGKLWKRFGPLHIYTPPKEYILALKITAGRDKDLADCAILLAQTKISTRQQAQQLLDQYITPEGQEKNAETIANSLDELFRKK